MAGSGVPWVPLPDSVAVLPEVGVGVAASTGSKLGSHSPRKSFEAGAKVQVRLRWAGWLMGDKGSPRWGQRPSVGHQPPGWSLLQPGAWLVAKVSLRACSRPGQRTPFSLPVALGCLCSPPRVPVTFWALRRPVWGVGGGNDMMGHTHTHTHILSRGQVRGQHHQ